MSTTSIPKIASAKDAVSVAGPLYGLDHEELWVLYLNNANKVLSFRMMSSGGIDSTVIDLRLIFRNALNLYATQIILFHNHPSGDPRPSQNDIEKTKQISEAGKIMNIKVLDHIIIGDGNYYSFADETVARTETRKKLVARTSASTTRTL